MPSIPELTQFFQSGTGKVIIAAFLAGYVYLLYLRKEHESRFQLQQLDILALSGLFGFLFYSIAVFLTLPVISLTSFTLASEFHLMQIAALLALFASLSGVNSLNQTLADKDDKMGVLGHPSSWGIWVLLSVLLAFIYALFLPLFAFLGIVSPVGSLSSYPDLAVGSFLFGMVFSFIAVYTWEWVGLASIQLFKVSVDEDRMDFQFFSWVRNTISSNKWYERGSRISFIATLFLTLVLIPGKSIPFKELLLPILFAASVLPIGSLIGSLIGEYLEEKGYFPLGRD